MQVKLGGGKMADVGPLSPPAIVCLINTISMFASLRQQLCWYRDIHVQMQGDQRGVSLTGVKQIMLLTTSFSDVLRRFECCTHAIIVIQEMLCRLKKQTRSHPRLCSEPALCKHCVAEVK